MSDAQETKSTPPYGSFSTFWNFITGLAGKPIPARFDRSIMTGKSGTDQQTITSALKFFGLIDENKGNEIRPEFVDLLSGTPDERKRALGSLVRACYPGQIKVSEMQGTEAQLHESFQGDFNLTGETRRKAATFFLHSAKEAGIELSPFFPKPRSGQGRTGPKKSAGKSKAAWGGSRRSASQTKDEVGDSTYTVTLESGSVVSLKVTGDLMDLMRNETDRAFLMGLVDAMEGYSSTAGDQADDLAQEAEP